MVFARKPTGLRSWPESLRNVRLQFRVRSVLPRMVFAAQPPARSPVKFCQYMQFTEREGGNVGLGHATPVSAERPGPGDVACARWLWGVRVCCLDGVNAFL